MWATWSRGWVGCTGRWSTRRVLDLAGGAGVMRLLVTGGRGLLGSEFEGMGVAAGHDVVAADREALDVTQLESARRSIQGRGFDWIVHCAAYTAVDRAEEDPEGARVLNVEGTRNVARAAREAGAGMVYVSTDYVFDGSTEKPYRPAQAPRPLSVYGRTKLEGERVVAEVFDRPGSDAAVDIPAPLIVRTGWLYGEGGRGFVRSMIDRAERGEALRVVNDQQGRPTFARHVATAVLELMSRASQGMQDGTGVGHEVWHVADGGEGSWFDLAEEAFRLSGVQADLRGVTSEEFGAPAPRPRYSVLDLTETERALGRTMPDWRRVLADVLTD